jgi:hypothetical protein
LQSTTIVRDIIKLLNTLAIEEPTAFRGIAKYAKHIASLA